MSAESYGPRVDELLATVTALEARVEQLHQYNREQADVLAELLPRFERLAAAEEHEPNASPASTGAEEAAVPVLWAQLSAEEAAVAWDDLARWVDTVAIPTLAPTARQVPPCWPMHIWGRETLSWLHHTHLQAYGPDGSAFQVAEWHTRWVPAAYAAIDTKGAARGGYCGVSEHRSERVEAADPLRTADWGPWLLQARGADTASRRVLDESEGAGR